jgi:hypothetical protein
LDLDHGLFGSGEELSKTAQACNTFSLNFDKGGSACFAVSGGLTCARPSCAGIAQLVEQLICNQQVVGSNPSAGFLLIEQADCLKLRLAASISERESLQGVIALFRIGQSKWWL